MGSFAGAQKTAAKRLGYSLDEYLDLLGRGLKWCSIGKHWETSDFFPPDSNRRQGKACHCKACQVAYDSARSKRTHHKLIIRNPSQGKAHKAVAYAVACGRMAPPGSIPCSTCGDTSRKHHYHHPRGYEPAHRLDVVVLCTFCHRVETRKEHGMSTFIPSNCPQSQQQFRRPKK